jgi:spermidine synthase
MFDRRFFLMAYGLSGAAALIYEIVWSRLLILEMGRGVPSTSIVLAAFMGGLAVGSNLAGRFSSRLTPRRALRAYLVLEITIAVFALFLPLELAAARPWLAQAYVKGNSGLTFQLLRPMVSLVLVAVPTAAMGATFPIASRWLVREARRAPGDAGWLYAVNTIGATVGAALAGFVLLPVLGLRQTTTVAVAFNLMAATVAWVIARRPEISGPATGFPSAPPPRSKRVKHPDSKEGKGFLWTAAFAMAVSGAASLALQVVWTRLAASILGPTTYAFSIVVTVFVGGLAAGTALAAGFAGRAKQPVLGLATCLLSSAGLAAGAVLAVDRALLIMAGWVASGQLDFAGLLTRQLLLFIALLAPMTLAFGATFPFAVAVGTLNDEKLSSDLGLIYAVNTCGAILGALLAGFVLISSFGLHNTIRVVIVVMAAAAMGLVAVQRVRGRSQLLAVGTGAAIALLGIGLPSWSNALLSSGVYKYASELGESDLDTWLSAGRLLYYREGSTATVSVRESLGSRSLSIDGKVDASNGADMLTQRMLAHLPLLLHPNPREVAILGLGSGVTVGSALKHPITHVDVLEISPEVVEASSSFAFENHRALADPRTHVIVEDGRLHLRLSGSRYDVIISEPSNPWIAGIASLFTREFFESAQAALAPGGLFCQWAHTYDINGEDLRSIVATFLSVFPDGVLWQIGKGDILLVAGAEPLEKRLGYFARHWTRPGVAGDLLDVGVSEPFDILSMFVAGDRSLREYAAGAVIQTDNRSELEFSGPRSTFGEDGNRNDDNLRRLAQAAPKPPAVQVAFDTAPSAAWRNRGWMMLKAEVHDTAWYDFARALEADPTDEDAYEGLRRASVPGATPGVNETVVLLRRLAGNQASMEAKVALARMLAATGRIEEATELLLEQYRKTPDDIRVLDQLAAVLSDAGDRSQRLPSVVARLRKLAPDAQSTRYHTAALLFQQGRPDLAAEEAALAVRDNPRHALAQNVLGAALAMLGQPDRAREAFEASLRSNSLSPRTYANLGMLELESGRTQEAVRRFAESLLLDPGSEDARRGLEQARVENSRRMAQ